MRLMAALTLLLVIACGGDDDEGGGKQPQIWRCTCTVELTDNELSSSAELCFAELPADIQPANPDAHCTCQPTGIPCTPDAGS